MRVGEREIGAHPRLGRGRVLGIPRGGGVWVRQGVQGRPGGVEDVSVHEEKSRGGVTERWGMISMTYIAGDVK